MRIAVAMSGGVDSSVAALLLCRENHEVIGVTMSILPGNGSGAAEDAVRVAAELGIAHHVLDLRNEFEREVIAPFCDEYLRGRTPSPCITCNRRIKFGRLLDFARGLGCERLATGHYARIGVSADGRRCVTRGVDPGKDQSYFLFMLTQEMLASVMFPLGDLTKSEVRDKARTRGLHAAERPESQEVCFVPGDDYPGFIEGRFSESVPPPGDIVDASGKLIGRHHGIHRYTIGQRRGLGIAAERPLYVLSIDAAANRITAGYREELMRGGLFASDINYMKVESLHDIDALVKIRSMHRPVQAHLTEGDGGVHVRFAEPQAGITPGQAAVFYSPEGDVLGGGWIERSDARGDA